MTTTAQDRKEKVEGVAAIILSAGRSQRMGAFKPLLPFGPTTVLQSCINYLRIGGVETVVVVVGHHASEIKTDLKNSNVIFAVNPDLHGEMTSSIGCGLAQLRQETKAVLIAPGDLPAVPPEVVAQLIAEWRKGAGLIKPTWEGRGGHPVLIDLSFRDELTRLDADRGLNSVFTDHVDQVKRLPVASNYIARDIDTWDDYAALHLEVFGNLPPARPGLSGSLPESN